MALSPSLEVETLALVCRMSTDFGAKFCIHSSPEGGPERWTYEAAPELVPAARKYLKEADRQRAGFDAAMVVAIRALQGNGGAA